MGQKDMSEKILEDYNDVFADIVNVFYFHGQQRVRPEALSPEKLRSHYKDRDNQLHEQERDVAKYWNEGGMKLALYGFENQEKAEKNMPLRMIGYDGAAYREQLLDQELSENYPVLSLVLYFGMKHWSAPKKLKEVLNIPKDLEPFVNDYGIQVCEVAWLTEEQVNLFQSDFKIVADFFVQKRKNKDYIPSVQQIKHVDAVLKLLAVFAKDERYKEILEIENEEVPRTMCEVYDKIKMRGMEAGRQEGIKEGIKALVETCQEVGIHKNEIIIKLKEKFSLSEEEALQYMEQYWKKTE